MTTIKPGMAGYCKLCQCEWLPKINQMLKDGKSAKVIGDWVLEASKGTLSFNRQTLYAHRDNRGGTHIIDADAPAPAPRAEPSGEVKPVTNDQFLERIRDLAYSQNLELDDSRIDLKTGLAAVKILEERKHQKAPVLVMARIFTGQLPTKEPETIEGEFREVTGDVPAQIGVTSD